MRAVAKAAGTTTPSLYQRFPSKQDIRRALRRRAQESLRRVIAECASPIEICEKYLGFACQNYNQYQLIFADLPEHRDDPRPNLELVKERFAQWLGGEPEEHVPVLMAVLALLHGAAVALNTHAIPERLAPALRRSAVVACRILLEHPSAFRS
jgi:AcrR family transcriptional regulator